MKVRQFEREDLAAILAIQEKCPEAAHWVESDYSRLTSNPGGMILVAVLDTATTPKVVGFAVFHRIIDEAELSNLAVDPDHQHQGVGRVLVEEGRKRLLEAGVRRVYLEVRVSNKNAQGLYYSLGFGLHSLRKDYYRNPIEDAYVLCLTLFPAEVLSTAP